VINDKPASLVNLLSYSDTERALLGSRRRFGDNGLKPFDVNMGFSDEDRIF